MGTVEINEAEGKIILKARMICYGTRSSDETAKLIADEIMEVWNEPKATHRYNGKDLVVEFRIEGIHAPALKPNDVENNRDPENNFFRIEDEAPGDISFVDALGGNTGYFKLANLLNKSTTAAHEFGHTLGLAHPFHLDIRGEGAPGIMYPRGTWVDPDFQYDKTVLPGETGGTINPFFRKVLQSDINDLGLLRLKYNNGRAVLGDFTNFWHDAYYSAKA